MIDIKIHTPEGVKDYLPDKAELKIETEKKIEEIFSRFGFRPVKSPTFEYSQVFEEKGSVKNEQMYKFLDREGSILALRSDITPAIARIAATAYNESDIPLRFYYLENVFRYNEHYQGKEREFTQAGAELIGINSADADVEIVSAAVISLMASGLREFKIGIGHVQFFNAVLEEAGFSKEICMEIKNKIIDKDYVAVKNITEKYCVNQNIKEYFEELPTLIGGPEIIDKAKSYCKSEKALKALNHIEFIYDMIKCCGLKDYIDFDLSATGYLDYYTGIVFRGYSFGTGFSIIDGGRYDNLIKNYGADYPSVGFAIKINNLLSALEKQNNFTAKKNTETLAVFGEKGRKTAIKVANELRSQGLVIENSLLGEDIDKNISYAKNKNIGGILYFIDEENVKVIDILNNETKELKISQLLKGEEQ